jgi:hypothetical protein
MAKYGFMGSLWFVIMNPQEKFNELIFFFYFFERNIFNFNDDRPCLTNRVRAHFFSVKVSYFITFSQS